MAGSPPPISPIILSLTDLLRPRGAGVRASVLPGATGSYRGKGGLSIADLMSFEQKGQLTPEFRTLLDKVPVVEGRMTNPIANAQYWKPDTPNSEGLGWVTAPYGGRHLRDYLLMHEGLHAKDLVGGGELSKIMSKLTPEQRKMLYDRYYGNMRPDPYGNYHMDAFEPYATAGQEGSAGIPPGMEDYFRDVYNITGKSAAKPRDEEREREVKIPRGVPTTKGKKMQAV